MMSGITMDVAAVVTLIGVTASELPGVILKQLAATSELTKQAMRERAPVGVGGENGLKGSIGFTINPARLSSEIKPKVPYADAVETGSKPHWVSAKPGSPLEQWARLKGLNVYAVQRSIATKGTKPHPYIVPTYQEVGPLVGAKFAQGITDLIGDLAYAAV